LIREAKLAHPGIVFSLGYGFVDFERMADAEKATQALQASGIQAQLAKVSTRRSAEDRSIR